MKRKYTSYLYVIAYLLLLRGVLFFTVEMGLLNMGILYDIILIMFWVGFFAYFMRTVKAQKIFYIVTVVVASIFTVGDSLYYDEFGILVSKTSASGLKFLSEGQASEYALAIPPVGYFVLPILILVIYLIISNKKRDVFYLKDLGILSFIFIMQIGIFIYWGSYDFDSRLDYYRSDMYLFQTKYDRILFSEEYGYYNYHLLDLLAVKQSFDYDQSVETIDDFFAAKEEHTTNDQSDIFNGYNLVTIMAESLDTRFISEELTPNLYSIMESSYTFEHYYTPVFQQGATGNSEFMTLTGLQAIDGTDENNNIVDVYHENVFPYALPNQLKGIGYNTYYFHSGYEWFYSRNVMIPNYGFETVKFQEDIYALGYDDFEERYDTDMNIFLDTYVDYSEPFYMNLLTYSGHGAYNQTDFDMYLDTVNAAYPNNDFDYEIINYMEKLVELDLFVGDVIDTLDSEGVLDETVIVIYPDHFPYMLDRDIYEEFMGISITDKEIHHQDIMIYNPNITPERFNLTGSTVDIAPTLLNMFDSNLEFRYFMGTDLFSTATNYVLFRDLTITDGTTYLDLEENYVGDIVNHVIFETALEKEIEAVEVQKLILYTDYFNKE